MNRKNVSAVLVIVIGLLISETTRAADSHAHHECAPGELELGFSVGYVHLDEDPENHDEDLEEHDDGDEGIGLHVHVGKRLGEHGLLSRLSLGIGGEVIFAEHEHYALTGYVSAYPWRGLVLSIGPGIEWAEHDGELESAYSTHFEAAYIFDKGDWHVGPVVDYSRTDRGEHFTVGVHFGVHL